MAMQEFFDQGELIEDNSSYKIVKIYKNSIISEEPSSIESDMYRKAPSEMNLRVTSPKSKYTAFKRMTSAELPGYAKHSEIRSRDQDVA